ncbi:unnamed protein product [Closterium sp. NIES-53]
MKRRSSTLCHLPFLPPPPWTSVTGLNISTLRNNLLSHRELQGVGITTIYPGFANYCDLYQTSSGRFLLRIPLCPRTRLYTLRTPRPSFCHITTRAGTSTGPPPPLPPPQVSPFPTSLPSSSLSTSSSTPSPSSSTALSHPAFILHHRLGHPNFAALRTTVTSCLLHSLPPTLPPLPSSPTPPCPSCIHGKLKQSPHHSHPTFAAAPIDLVHMDLWGPYPIRSRQGHRYMLVLVDDHSRYSTVFFLHTKDQVPAVVINRAEQCRNNFKRPIGHLHSDGGGEFINNTLATFCKLHGIQQTSTLPHSPQQNGIAETMPFSMPPSSSISTPTLSIPPLPPQNSGLWLSLLLPAFVFRAASPLSSSHRPIAPVPPASSPPVPLSESTPGTIATPQATCSSTLPPTASSAALTSSSTSPSPTTPLLLLDPLPPPSRPLAWTDTVLPPLLPPSPLLPHVAAPLPPSSSTDVYDPAAPASPAHSAVPPPPSPSSSHSPPSLQQLGQQQQQQPVLQQRQRQQQQQQQQQQQPGQQQRPGQQQQQQKQPTQQQGQQQQQQRRQQHRATPHSSPFLLLRMHTPSLDKVIGALPPASIQLLEDSHEEFLNIRHHNPFLASIFLDFLGLPVLGATSNPTIFTPSTYKEAIA